MRAKDTLGMLGAVSARPEQISDAFRIVDGVDFSARWPQNIIVCGMGGSAMAADMLGAWLSEKSPVPFSVWRDYGLPAAATSDTLVIAASYSGNTEETLSALQQAKSRGCRIMGIAAGGKLAALCKSGNYPLFLLPAGMQPRVASGYMFAIQALIAEKLGVCRSAPDLRDCIRTLRKMRPGLLSFDPKENIALSLARALRGRTPVVYGHGILSPVARCWHAHFCENSKILAFWGEFPEMNHNETVGWVGDRRRGNFVPIVLRDTYENPRIRRRIEITGKIAFGGDSGIIEVPSQGHSAAARMLSSLWVGEFASIYLARLGGTDPGPVKIVEALKQSLAGKVA